MKLALVFRIFAYDENMTQTITAFFNNNEPALLNIFSPEQMTEVEPKLIAEHPIEDMFPFLSRKLSDMMIINPL